MAILSKLVVVGLSTGTAAIALKDQSDSVEFSCARKDGTIDEWCGRAVSICTHHKDSQQCYGEPMEAGSTANGPDVMCMEEFKWNRDQCGTYCDSACSYSEDEKKKCRKVCKANILMDLASSYGSASTKVNYGIELAFEDITRIAPGDHPDSISQADIDGLVRCSDKGDRRYVPRERILALFTCLKGPNAVLGYYKAGQRYSGFKDCLQEKLGDSAALPADIADDKYGAARDVLQKWSSELTDTKPGSPLPEVDVPECLQLEGMSAESGGGQQITPAIAGLAGEQGFALSQAHRTAASSQWPFGPSQSDCNKQTQAKVRKTTNKYNARIARDQRAYTKKYTQMQQNLQAVRNEASQYASLLKKASTSLKKSKGKRNQLKGVLAQCQQSASGSMNLVKKLKNTVKKAQGALKTLDRKGRTCAADKFSCTKQLMSMKSAYKSQKTTVEQQVRMIKELTGELNYLHGDLEECENQECCECPKEENDDMWEDDW